MRKIFFFKIHAENKTWGLVPDLFLSFKKALLRVETSSQQRSFNTLGYTIKTTV